MEAVKDKKKKLVKRKERNQLKNTKVKVNADRIEVNDTPLSKYIFQSPPYIHKNQESEFNNEQNDEDMLSDYEDMLEYLDICSDIEDDDIEDYDDIDSGADDLESDQDILSWSSSASSQTSSYTLRSMNNLLLADQICENPEVMDQWWNNNGSGDDDEEDEEDDDLSDGSNVSLESYEHDEFIDLPVNDNLSSSSLSDVFEDANDIEDNSSDIGL